MEEETYYVNVREPAETRRALLETSRQVVIALQSYENFKLKRIKKLDLVEKLREQTPEYLEFQFYIVGGIQCWSNDILREVEGYLTQRFPPGKVVYRDVLDKWSLYHLGKSFVLDTRNGNIFCLNPSIPVSQMGISVEN